MTPERYDAYGAREDCHFGVFRGEIWRKMAFLKTLFFLENMQFLDIFPNLVQQILWMKRFKFKLDDSEKDLKKPPL